MPEKKNLWGGRFSSEADPGFAEFNRSFAFDRRLFDADVRASMAHCKALTKAEVLTLSEAKQINDGLQTILQQGHPDNDQVQFEDIHSFVESRLVELIGDTGLKLHAGRSRNDQVATDLRLWLR
jgi:argininosuccinate lyase